MTSAPHSVLLFALVLGAFHVAAGQAGNEGRIASDLRREGDSFKSCKQFNFGGLSGCGETLITGQPLHLAIGSLAPQNGVSFGAAFVEHQNFADEWRINWNLDAVATGNGSWRAGVYLKAFRLPGGQLKVVHPVPVAAGQAPSVRVPVPQAPLYSNAPLFNLYAEANSLNKLYFFGLGPESTPAGRGVFGLTEPVIGASLIYPAGKPGFVRAMNLALLGELNGRFPSLRGNHGENIASIEQFYSEATAPGLLRQPATLQAGEGLRLQPSLFHDSLRLNYLASSSNTSLRGTRATHSGAGPSISATPPRSIAGAAFPPPGSRTDPTTAGLARRTRRAPASRSARISKARSACACS